MEAALPPLLWGAQIVMMSVRHILPEGCTRRAYTGGRTFVECTRGEEHAAGSPYIGNIFDTLGMPSRWLGRRRSPSRTASCAGRIHARQHWPPAVIGPCALPALSLLKPRHHSLIFDRKHKVWTLYACRIFTAIYDAPVLRLVWLLRSTRNAGIYETPMVGILPAGPDSDAHVTLKQSTTSHWRA